MKKMEHLSTWLLEFKSNTYSQAGEDGVIAKILEVLPCNDKWSVEFGAWDGQNLSNTRNLIVNQGYSGILIEGDEAKFGELQRNYSQNKEVITCNRYVGFREDNNLDLILQDTSIPIDFDFLSIDIDGNDYHVWKAASKYKPKVVCIEFNPTVPPGLRFVQPADPSVNQGASLLSLVELGQEKGYELVSVLDFNAFFVRSEYYPLFQIDDNGPNSLQTELKNVTYMFSGYDGKVILRGSRELPWHRVRIEESKMQPLARFFRKQPDKLGRIPRTVLRIRRSVLKRIRTYRDAS